MVKAAKECELPLDEEMQEEIAEKIGAKLSKLNSEILS
jgi:hypothetical protein